MHYCCLVITKEFPTMEGLEQIMKPFNSEGAYNEEGERICPRPCFTWDWWQIGGRYSGKLKLRHDLEDERYGWKFYSKGGRNGKQFWSYLLTQMETLAKSSKDAWRYTEDDCYSSMGSRDGYLYVDGARIADITNFFDNGCYCCVDRDGNAISRQSWDGNAWNDDPGFDIKLDAVKAASGDCYATIIDLHD